MIDTNTISPVLERPDSATTESYAPVCIAEVELAEILPTLTTVNGQTGQHYQSIHCVVRLHSQPLGIVKLDCGDGMVVEPHQYAPSIWNALHQQINDHLQSDGLPTIGELSAAGLWWSRTPACIVAREEFLANAPLVSVIVSTHDRADRLVSCLQALFALRYPAYEIIVVDNAPSTADTFELVQRLQESAPNLRYEREDRQGLSWARNRGIRAAKGEILAFTDDDVIVDPLWLVEMVRAFQGSEKVACVTGLVLALELETVNQAWFEQYGGFSKGFTRRIFDLHEHHPNTFLFPYSAGKFGTGASIAFTAAFLHQVGGFDPALGAGSPAQGGEDLAAFFQVIMEGYTLVYEPSSLVYHQHRRDYAALHKQIYNYGLGLTAYLTKNIVDHPSRALDLLIKIPFAAFFLFRDRLLSSRKKSKLIDDGDQNMVPYPKQLITLEIKGMFYGPGAYLKGQRASGRDREDASSKKKLPYRVSRGAGELLRSPS